LNKEIFLPLPQQYPGSRGDLWGERGGGERARSGARERGDRLWWNALEVSLPCWAQVQK